MRVTQPRKPSRFFPTFVSTRTAIMILVIALLTGILFSENLLGQQAQWIWNGQQINGNVPLGPVHFRKTFSLPKPVVAEVVIAADDEFQVYFNGELVGYGNGYDKLTKIDLTPHLIDGENLLAIRATNTAGNTGAVAAVSRFKLEGETAWRWLATDETWASVKNVDPTWKNLDYDDERWPQSQVLGAFGATTPWDAARLQTPPKNQVAVETETAPVTTAESNLRPAANTGERKKPAGRNIVNNSEKAREAVRHFTVPQNFEVQQVLDESIGSLIAMEFNEFGQIVLSREGGKLLLADLSNSESGEINVRECCNSMENVQGILPLNGDLYVTGSGPEGLGLYRLSDKDRDGMYEADSRLVEFKGELSEHGPHGLTLGPDGMIYIMIGNASGIAGEVHQASPAKHFYEGNLLPRMEDPGGHAAGVKAPGGTIIRITPDGSRREIVASGIRNSYDLAFNKHGDLFFHDSDMESDIGTPWYRPTKVFHATDGADFGWRSGTAKFPEYYIDNIPGIADTGRGSPTGAVVYDHVMMPVRYHGSLFLGDWSEGRILAVHTKPDEDSFTSEVETFLSSAPLTVTDVSVGPDGALYFVTGGRGTQGGVYRVVWNGQVPDEYRLLSNQLSQLVNQPQPQAAWTRQELAKLRTSMGDEWGKALRGILTEQRNETKFRVRALEMLGLYGPAPTDEILEKLTNDPDPVIREKAIRMISWRPSPILATAAVRGLSDQHARIRRASCETLTHIGHTPKWTDFKQSLQSSSRTEALAARRLLESIPADQWRDDIMETDNVRVFLQGATALMIVEPTLPDAYRILAGVSSVMDGFVNDSDFADLLRVTQLAMIRGKVDADRIPVFHDRILGEFPTGNGILNRELSRIIGYLKDERITEQIENYLTNGSDNDADKLQVVLNLQPIAQTFTDPQRLAVITFLERMKTQSTTKESNYGLYLNNILAAWSADVSETQISEILKNGAQWPSAALNAFYKLPRDLTEQQVEWISEMDRQLKGRVDATAQQARIGCIAVLGRSADEKSMYYLREVWRHETDRRNDVVLALAQQPDGPNWPYLISSLSELNDDTATEVMTQLATVNKSPREPKFFRHAIMTGYRLRQNGAQSTNQLLQHWTGKQVEGTDWQTIIQQWATWFNERFPDEQPISFEDKTTVGKYSVDQILQYMESEARPPLMHSGMLAFQKAQCVQCHRFNGQGESMGPDLTTVANRFSKRETLRSILHPSEVISSQYASKKILTTDGQQLIGLVSDAGTGMIVVLTDAGEKLTLTSDDIDEIAATEVSAMPESLLDELTLEEINDLVGYLYSQNAKTAAAANENADSTR